jgi:hypothetical protein
MDWHEINITQDAAPSPQDVPHMYLTSARKIWEQAGCPEGFRVYQNIAPDYDLFLYFNPEARMHCRPTGLLSVGRVCSEPSEPGVLMIP